MFLLLQVRYHMFSRTMVETDVVPWCREHGVGILAHSVLGKGLCTGKHPADKVWAEDDERGTDQYNLDFEGERWSGPNGFVAATDKLKLIAERKGIGMAELAVA